MQTGIKLVPLFSLDYFEDFYGALDGSDYTYMYPDSKWERGHGDMNWGNAMVTESEVRTSNGFIYFVDQVVPPQKSIEQYISKEDKYSLYYDLMQRFATYTQGQVDDQKRQLYLKNYNLVSNIAEEQGAFVGDASRTKDMFTAFLPPNDVLQAYLDRTILQSYASIDSVPKVTLYYILQTQLSRSLGLISKISQSYFNAFGDPMIITKSDIRSTHMCSNGLIYEMNKVLEPNVFTCVPGQLFVDAHYSTFLYALNQSDLMSNLSNTNSKVTLFAPSNDELEAYNIRYNSITSSIEYRGQDKVWKNMNTLELTMVVKDHIYDGVFPDLSGEGYVEMSSGNFVHFSNGTLQGPENMRYNQNVMIDKAIPNDKNGMLYDINMPIKSKWIMGKWLAYDKEVSQFTKLLVSTKLLDTRYLDQTTRDTLPNLKFLGEADYWTAFIPTNAAMTAASAAGLIPTNTDSLKNFLLYHFIRGSAVFDDGGNIVTGKGVSGSYDSERIDSISTTGTVYAKLKVNNVKNSLTITDHSGQVVTVDHSKADILVRKGVAHKISSVLKYK
jgi:uncharacterized surface protein with fasciclin (FAS1) repeats